MSFGCPVGKQGIFSMLYCSIGFKVNSVHYFIQIFTFSDFRLSQTYVH